MRLRIWEKPAGDENLALRRAFYRHYDLFMLAPSAGQGGAGIVASS
jgi:hypothetical protein